MPIFTLLLIGLILYFGEPLLSFCILGTVILEVEYILLRIPRNFPLAPNRPFDDISRIGVLKAPCSSDVPRPRSVDGETFLFEKAVVLVLYILSKCLLDSFEL